MWGYRNFDTTDKSTNNTLGQWLFGFPGAMLHNNHHAFPDEYNYKMSEKWYETDFLNVFIIEKILKL
jgi:fatty-acid desaturase